MNIITKYLSEFKIFLTGLLITYDIDVNVVTTLIILLFADFFIGMLKHYLVDELVFSIKEARKGFVVKSLVILLVFLVAVAGKTLSVDFALYVDIFMKVFICNELFSVINNWRSIKANRDIKTEDFIAILINGLEEKIKKFINSKL